MGGNGVAMSGGDLAQLTDFYSVVQDQFLDDDVKDSHWLTAVRLASQIGYPVLTMAAVSKYDDSPLWVRTTMSEAWVQLYLERDYFQHDPLIKHMKQSNDHLVLDCDEPASPSDKPELTRFRQDARRFGFGRFRGIPFNWPSQSVWRLVTFGLMANSNTSETPEMVAKARILADVFATRITTPRDEISFGVMWPRKAVLTERERELLHYLALGLKNDRIAERCGLAEVTVRKHLLSARQKLGASTREQALAMALYNGLIDF